MDIDISIPWKNNSRKKDKVSPDCKCKEKIPMKKVPTMCSVCFKRLPK